MKKIDTYYTITGQIAGKNGTRPFGTFSTKEEAFKKAEETPFNIFTIREVNIFETIFGRFEFKGQVVSQA